jgi:hypothetical protein
MNRKQFVFLLVLVAVVGFAGWLLHQRGESAWHSSSKAVGQKLLGDFQINDVAQINIKQGTNEVNLLKKDDLWRVRERDDYPANFSEIGDFLVKASEVKVVQIDEVGVSQAGKYQLAIGPGTNSALVVSFKDKGDKTIKSLLLGKKHMRKSNRPSPMGMDDMDSGFPDGRYVKTGPDATVVALISEPFANVEPQPEKWLNKDFVKIEKIRSVSATYPVETNSFKLSRETESGEWKLADAKPTEQVDTSKTSVMASCSPSFSDVVINPKPEQLGLDKPTQLSLETFDNFTYNLKIGGKTNEHYPVTLTVSAQLPKERTPGKDEKPEDKANLDKTFKENQKKLEEKLANEKKYEKWTYLVEGYSLDSVLKERNQLLQEKKEEPKKDNAPMPPANPTVPSSETPPLVTPGPLVPPAPMTNAAPAPAPTPPTNQPSPPK